MTKVLNLVFGPVMKLKLNQTLFGTACLVSMLIAMAAPAAAQTNSADVSLDIAVPMSALSRVSTPNTKTVTPKQTPRSVFLEGRAYHDGEGRPQDFVKAQTLYRKAAAMGSNGARINLGYMAFIGEGVAQNFAEARYWYEIAAKTGDKDARQNLIMMDQRGLGLEAFTPPTPLSPQIAEDQSVIDVIDVETPLIPASPEDMQPIEDIEIIDLSPAPAIQAETPVLKAAPLALRSTSKVVAVSPVMPSVTQPVHMEPTQTEQNDTHINQTEVEAETIEVSDPVYLNAEAKQTENKSPVLIAESAPKMVEEKRIEDAPILDIEIPVSKEKAKAIPPISIAQPKPELIQETAKTHKISPYTLIDLFDINPRQTIAPSHNKTTSPDKEGSVKVAEVKIEPLSPLKTQPLSPVKTLTTVKTESQTPVPSQAETIIQPKAQTPAEETPKPNPYANIDLFAFTPSEIAALPQSEPVKMVEAEIKPLPLKPMPLHTPKIELKEHSQSRGDTIVQPQSQEVTEEAQKTNPYALVDLFAFTPSQIEALPQSEPIQIIEPAKTSEPAKVAEVVINPLPSLPPLNITPEVDIQTEHDEQAPIHHAPIHIEPVAQSEPVIKPESELHSKTEAQKTIKPIHIHTNVGSIWSRMKIRIATKPHAPKESSFQEFDAREPNVNESHLEVAPMKDPVDTAETFETGEYKVAEMTVAETFPPVASTAPKVVKRAAADESLKNRRHIITIVGSIVFVVLSVFLWLSVKFKGALFARSKRKFFREFYEANRAVLRETYLRYPEGQRSVGGAEQSWSVLLSVMAVRFAQQQAEAGEKLTDYAQYILKAVDENAQDENQKNAYAFLPDLDKKIRNDCRAFTQEFLTQSSEMDTAIHDGLLA